MVDYNYAYKKDREELSAVDDAPEVIEDPVEEELDEDPVEEESVEETEDSVQAVDEIVEETADEETVDLTGVYVLPFVDDVGKLRVRSKPNGEVVTYVSNQVRLKVVKDDDPEWVFVEFTEAGEVVRGYVKKSFVVEE